MFLLLAQFNPRSIKLGDDEDILNIEFQLNIKDVYKGRFS